MLNRKIYQPYLISDETINEYKMESLINVAIKQEKLSIKDILVTQHQKGKATYYFKVDLYEEFGNESLLYGGPNASIQRKRSSRISGNKSPNNSSSNKFNQRFMEDENYSANFVKNYSDDL